MFQLQPVSRILVGAGRTVEGVALEDGAEVRAKVILSNATPKITFLDLLPKVYKTFKFTQIAWIAWERDETVWERDRSGHGLGMAWVSTATVLATKDYFTGESSDRV